MFPDCISCTLWQKLILRTELIERKNGAHWRAPLRVVFSFSSRFVHVATLSENSRAIHSPAHYAAREATATKKRTHCLLIRGSTEGKTLTGPPVRGLGHAREEDKRLEIKHRHDNLVGGRSVDRPGSEVTALRLFYCLRVCVVREKAWIRGYKYERQWARSQTNERRPGTNNRRNSLNDTAEATSLPLKPRGQTFFILFFTWLTDLSRFNVVYLFPPPYPRPLSSTHAFFPSSFLHFAIASTSNFQIGNGQTGGKEKKGAKQRRRQWIIPSRSTLLSVRRRCEIYIAYLLVHSTRVFVCMATSKKGGIEFAFSNT